jgi:SAM-dependent methyltransferase
MSAPDPIALCLAGHISAHVALARLALQGASAAEIEHRLRQLPDRQSAILWQLLQRRRTAIDDLARLQVDHARADASSADALVRIASEFDQAVSRAPEVSVASFSLGDPSILAEATEEIVNWLSHTGVLRRGVAVLDLGCGFGRIAAALATRGHAVLGLDISAAMIAEAERRHAHISNLRFAATPGTDLQFMPDAGFDLILAVDSFPYLVQAGVADQHIMDAVRCLRPDGSVAILNLSYRDDPAADAKDAARWAATYGLQLEVMGETPFALWDGRAFVFRKPPSG